MAVMLINSPTLADRDAATKRFTALFEPGDCKPVEFYFDLPIDFPVQISAEPFLTALLPIAMLNGLDIISNAPVRSGFLHAARRVRDILHCWYPDRLTKISLSAPESHAERRGTGTGIFFSGGVDSFYSLRKNLDLVTHFTLVNGFDIADWNNHMWPSIEATLRKAAQEFGRPLFAIETNLRQVADCRMAPWGSKPFDLFWLKALQGSALASIAYLLSSSCATVIVPSTHTYNNLAPYGSHPLIDETWSSPNLRIEHDGSEAGRFEKIAAIHDFPIAMKYLRVCWRNWEDKYNCGRCEKCLRTILIFRLQGALEKAPTLGTFNPETYRTINLPPELRYYYQEFLGRAKLLGDREAIKACEFILGKRFDLRRISGKLRAKTIRLRKRVSNLVARKSSPPKKISSLAPSAPGN